MHFTDSELTNFDKRVLKIKKPARQEYIRQVDNLINCLEKKVKEDTTFGVQKFLKAGSLRKGTVLKPRGDKGIDADIAIFLKTENASEYDLANLHQRILNLLIAVYPQKKPDDFKVQPRTLGIEFTTSGLAVDLVPVIPHEEDDTYGWQPSSQGGPPLLTSISGQLEFIRVRAYQDRRFKRLVRMLKTWRNELELELKSFAIELILAHLQDVHGPAPDLERGLLRFFLYMAQSELATPISFPENGPVDEFPDDQVVILDPVNAENNVTTRLTNAERIEIVEQAQNAWETITIACRNGYIGETLDYWKEVFGRSFTIEAEEDDVTETEDDGE